ncbi:histidine kinase [Lachnospiraceae bacterium OttesenSCG-928-D06]|nr:histidine kinase [Lachnospiraceae bacterium OttesenSCG-928-D06]
MNIENTRFMISVALDIYGSLVTLILLLCLITVENRKERLNRLFGRILVCNIGMLLTDAAVWVLDGNTLSYGNFLLKVMQFMMYSFSYLVLTTFTHYMVVYVGEQSLLSKRLATLAFLFCGISLFLLVLSQFFNWYYYVDENNVYHRGKYYLLSQLFAFAGMGFNGVIVLLNRKKLGKKETVFLCSYMALPVVAFVLQLLFYGLTVTNFATTLSAVLVYGGIQRAQAKKLQKKEVELADHRIDITISQIQPHFLYNVLVVIRQLCELNPKKAQEAVTEFAAYLRGNMDALQRKTLVLFEKEMMHVENYLSLEKKRFGDRVHVIYELDCMEFLLPALSIQPIVENAVRYGITKKEDGGTIWIKSTKESEVYRIVVEDDGVGFETDQKKKDGRSHIGIENVRKRLAYMCGGTMEIRSEIGQGTQVIIDIPREK